MVDIRYLSDFLELARSGNFSSAARKRNISQPALSRRIQQLEEWAGGLLVDRSASPSRLTDRGKEFEKIVVEAVSNLEQFRRKVRRDDLPVASLRLMSLYSLTSTFLPGWLGPVSSPWASPALEISFGSHDHCFDALQQRTADVALLYFTETVPEARFGSLSRLAVGNEKFVPVISRDYASTLDAWRFGAEAGPGPAMIELPRDIYVGKALASAVDRAREGFERSTVVIAPRIDLVRGLVEAGHGIGWLPLNSVREELSRGQLRAVAGDDLEVAFDIVLVATSQERLALFEKH
ncbi:MAG: LysR family transcriptional regulator, hypochlorite-specific transcription factor HypT [Acetobacteraceae bacterium]|jgi:DNA-binding transcriptional LysR family regulator|nr:LysR family transcriptional regulator, hypochlorite-specific transcription factor HypT [Acetobacteraceae bacterium]